MFMFMFMSMSWRTRHRRRKASSGTATLLPVARRAARREPAKASGEATAGEAHHVGEQLDPDAAEVLAAGGEGEPHARVEHARPGQPRPGA